MSSFLAVKEKSIEVAIRKRRSDIRGMKSNDSRLQIDGRNRWVRGRYSDKTEQPNRTLRNSMQYFFERQNIWLCDNLMDANLVLPRAPWGVR